MTRAEGVGVRHNRAFPGEDAPELTYILNR